MKPNQNLVNKWTEPIRIYDNKSAVSNALYVHDIWIIYIPVEVKLLKTRGIIWMEFEIAFF